MMTWHVSWMLIFPQGLLLSCSYLLTPALSPWSRSNKQNYDMNGNLNSPHLICLPESQVLVEEFVTPMLFYGLFNEQTEEISQRRGKKNAIELNKLNFLCQVLWRLWTNKCLLGDLWCMILDRSTLNHMLRQNSLSLLWLLCFCNPSLLYLFLLSFFLHKPPAQSTFSVFFYSSDSINPYFDLVSQWRLRVTCFPSFKGAAVQGTSHRLNLKKRFSFLETQVQHIPLKTQQQCKT